MSGAIAVSGQVRSSCRILYGKIEQKTLYEILRHRWENNIKVDIKGRHLDEVN
jgi:hypothetical protein